MIVSKSNSVLYNGSVLLAVGTSIRLLLTIVFDGAISRIMFSYVLLNHRRHNNYHRLS